MSPAIGWRERLRRYLNNQFERDEFVIEELAKLPDGCRLLDAGAGSQRYRPHCRRFEYHAQDFGEFKTDVKPGMASTAGGATPYEYGSLDYVGDVWEIAEADRAFDAVLCTEVLEHIPYPIRALGEFARLLKPGGTLILTAPSNCLRHMDPYFFYGGFSDRFYERILAECGFDIIAIHPVGDYYRWLGVEMYRTAATHSWIAKIALLPAFIYYLLKRPTEASTNTLCMGYHVAARRR